jgi:tetratricopeptide (TPR) repeat protein
MVKFASSVELDGLGRQETALMIASVNEGGRRFTDAAIDEIQRLTKGYPLFVRWLVSDAVQRGHSAPSGEIDRAEIEERLMILVGKYGDALSPAAESLAPRQRAFCILVAKLRQNGHMATERAISMELRQLGSPIADANADIASEAAGLLETKLLTFNRNFASYSFAVPLIEKWFASAFSMKNIEEAMTATDERLAGYLKTAALAYEEKDYGKAVRLYRAIAVRYPDSFEGRIGLSQALEREGKSSSEDIVSHYEIAYRLDPDGSRRAYKGFLKNAAKAGSPFFLEKVVELGDSTIEDRKAFVRSFFEVWRSQVVEGDFHQFLAAMETKPWILKEYRSEVIGFIDGLMGEFLSANPSAAEEFLSAFRGKIDETQLRIWLVRIRKPLESAPTKIINPPLKPEIPKAVPAEKKRLRISLPPLPLRKLFTGLLVVAAVVAAGLVLPHLSKFWNDLSLEKPERFSKESEIGRLPANQPGLQKPPVTGGVSLKQDTVHIREAAPASASSEKAPDTTARTIAPRKDMPGVAPAPGEVRVMLINASSMLQKGMAAKARKQLAAKGFSPQNIFVGTHSDKVSRVYGYYCSKEYIPVLKEIFGALYPGKPQSFFDISPQEKTINGWIRRSFRDERLDVLIRMPNEE